ncbi:TetR/AcrR family transcriptional regulator [Croceicoccus gelatinilyticus]|uniref:TetR/AcrR family transcriptional regulator n=1 Tax=Croceicoccus gelatinilyticus TaxID=2835536 RepID=UPI001BCD8BB8|nr:TetR/AcrR family transcriptional regulator [Croceicoccus gelatinilyticus]MBS7670836.1 TetR/AcrR family transcriptional regulator [Croceicoccus gelatinilyticus]
MEPVGEAADETAAQRALTPRQRERRARILSTTYSLLAEHGYDGVSMKMIAKSAKVAERTLFNIYSSKDLLIATSARERSDGIMLSIADNADGGELGYFYSLADTLAYETLAAPALARGLATVLVRYPDLVGLGEIYERHVGEVLKEFAERGRIGPEVVSIICNLFAMRIVSLITLWSGGMIGDDALNPQMRLAVCQVLAPHLDGDLQAEVLAEARAAVARIRTLKTYP